MKEKWEELRELIIKKAQVDCHDRLALSTRLLGDPTDSDKRITCVYFYQGNWKYVLGCGFSEEEAILEAIDVMKNNKKVCKTAVRQ